MDMNAIREYIISDSDINQLVGDNVFLFERPENSECGECIIYTFKELNGGFCIRDYQLDIRIVGKDKLKLLEIKDRIIEILDNFSKPTKISDTDTVIRHTRLINGGGIVKDPESKEYNVILYFLVKV